jgi:polysaccharide deacetylase family protein (PEP-CTERM system associated)
VGAVSSRYAERRERVALSFDIECYYQVVTKDYLGKLIRPTDEVLRNTNWILDLLNWHGAKATFFFLGNVAEHYPELVRRAVDEGHEIGVHGYDHHYVRDMTEPEFRREISSAIDRIRSAGAPKVSGHRATAFSINRRTLWALDTLRDLGVEYDSSIFPFSGHRYGIADWPRRPGPTGAGITEVPLSVVELAGRRVPCMGGGYVRCFPVSFTRWCASQLHNEGLTPVAYFHPYDFELSKPRFTEAEVGTVDKATSSRLRRFNRIQGIGRGKPMRRKLEWILQRYSIVPVGALTT